MEDNSDPARTHPAGAPHSFQTYALEPWGGGWGLDSFGSKGMGAPAGWVPAGSLLTSTSDWLPWLACWLAGFIHFPIDLLLTWFKTKRKKNQPLTFDVLHEKMKTVLQCETLKIYVLDTQL